MAGSTAADSMAVSPAADSTPASPASVAGNFTPDFSVSMAAEFIAGCTNFIPAHFSQGFMNFMPAASTTAIFANSTNSANSTDLITTASAVDLLSSPLTPAGGAVDGAGPITITQTAATTGPDPTPDIGITAPIRRATTPT